MYGLKHSTKEKKGIFVSEGWELFIQVIYIVKLDQTRTLFIVFTLILPEGEVQTREGQNHESLIVSNRDKYSLQLTPKVKGNWERRSRGKNRSQRENERKRNKSGCEEKEDNKKK